MPPAPAPTPASPPRRSLAFLLVYGLANAGGVIAFLPLLTLLLPVKIEAMAGDSRIGLVTATVFAGAVTASLSNIGFGALSDRSVARGGGRRRWVLGGIVATSLSYAVVTAATTPVAIVLAIVLFQAAVNAALGPLVAIMADEIPDAQKGLAGGMLAFANPTAAAVSTVMVSAGSVGEAGRLAIVIAAAAACIAPLLLTRSHPVCISPELSNITDLLRRDLTIAWVARLLFQIAGSVLFYYLLYYFESVSPTTPQSVLAPRVGHLMTVAYIVPLPIAVLLGRWSDRIGRRKPMLLTAATLSAIGLLGMALARAWWPAALAFGLYAVGSSTFLALHSVFSMQLLPNARHRGRDLGLLNLTNTLPAMLGPVLTWWLATPSDFTAVMLVLAALALSGGLFIPAVRGRR